MTTTFVQFPCPTCGRPASATLAWQGAAATHPEVVEYRCPTGCEVDSETVRQITGASNT